MRRQRDCGSGGAPRIYAQIGPVAAIAATGEKAAIRAQHGLSAPMIPRIVPANKRRVRASPARLVKLAR
jgi:hypothetical protein